MPNLVNTADGVTPPVLNTESVSWCDRLYEVGCCHAADARQKKTNHSILFEFFFLLNDRCTKNGEKNVSNNNVKQKTTPHSQIMR